jgi:hypothetical protein
VIDEPISKASQTYVLAADINATRQERRVLATLGIRRNGAGSLPALRTAVRATAAAAARHPSTRASAWVAIFAGLEKRIAAAARAATWLDMPCPVIAGRTVADFLASPVRSTLPKEARDRLDAWLGIQVFFALSRGCVLSTSVPEDWDTLRRTGTPRAGTAASWVSTAKCMPLDAAEITKVLPGIRNERLKEALKVSLVAIATDVPDPELSTDLGTDSQESTGEQAALESEQGWTDSEDDGDDDTDDDTDIEASNDCASHAERWSLLSLLISRGIHSGYRGHFGLTGIHGELPTLNLQRTCLALAATLITGTEADRTRAAVAELSLKVSLSPRRTLQLALQRNDDIWLDLDGESLYWNFDRVRDVRERDNDDEVERGRSTPVRIRLSHGSVVRLRELHRAQPLAASVRQLARIEADALAIKAWLEAYGHFLRAHGDLNYKAYAVRFARSYRSVYLDRGHGAVAAAVLGLDFCTVPPGLLHYISLSEEQLTAWQLDVDRYLGLLWTPSSAVEAR